VKKLPFSTKVQETITNTGFLNVWEGSVRSSKTLASLTAWALLYVAQSPEGVFLMSGATLGSISRNCITGDFGFLNLFGGEQRTDTDGSKFIEWLGKRLYYVGSDNIRSFQKIRGMSIGGWYADEIDLHHEAFIVEAFNRSLASTDRKNFWTLNPNVPSHPIYKNYIDKYLEESVPGYHYHHFTLDDNPSMTAERKAEIATQYSGIFYRRFILGERVRAEGSIYTSFDPKRHVLKAIPEDWRILFAEIGGDIGGNKSATDYICTGYFWKNNRLCCVVMDELYDKDNLGTEAILNEFKQFVLRNKPKCTLSEAYLDSAEQLIIKSAKNLGIINVHGSKKIAIVDRIRLVHLMFSQDRLFILSQCKDLIEAIENAVWDAKSNNEQRLDDGSTKIDPLDAMEYSIERRYKELI